MRQMVRGNDIMAETKQQQRNLTQNSKRQTRAVRPGGSDWPSEGPTGRQRGRLQCKWEVRNILLDASPREDEQSCDGKSAQQINKSSTGLTSGVRGESRKEK